MKNWKEYLLSFGDILSRFSTIQHENYIDSITYKLNAKEKLNKVSLEKEAKKYGITNVREVKEQTEYALVGIYRKMAHDKTKTIEERFYSIVDFYKRQVNLSLRTSTSVLLQQYSTAAPIAYLMGLYCGIDKPHKSSLYLEPSAGNGLLTIAGYPENFEVNELDDIRIVNLQRDKYNKITKIDSSKQGFFKDKIQKYDAIITNPPFGALEKYEYQTFDGYTIKDLDHVMSILSLSAMKDNGRAAIIIGGHTSYDEEGRIQGGKNRIFLNYLYSHYNVQDAININGDLYSRMGTSFNIRLILIDGRKKEVSGYAPLQDNKSNQINTFQELYQRIF